MVHIAPGVARIPGQHDFRALADPDPQRLVAGGMAVGGDNHQAAVTKNILLAVHGLVVERMVIVLGIEQGLGPQLGVLGGGQLVLLDQEGRGRKELVATGVVKVKVGVDDVADIVRGELEFGQLGDDLLARFGL